MDNTFTQFTTPAEQGPKDFRQLGMMDQLPQFEQRWSHYVDGWTQSSIIGDPWSGLNDAPRSNYFNPLTEGFGAAGGDAVITWIPFPNRLITFFTWDGAENNPQLKRKLTTDEVMAMADTNVMVANGIDYHMYCPDEPEKTLVIPGTRCPSIDWSQNWVPFSPQGPRGWLDEYCEWSITRNSDHKMMSIMFTCENPAYYLALWRVNPKAVLGLYQQYIDPACQLEDLYLRYSVDQPTGKKGESVIDPTTGNPAYDPTNKWNNSTVRVAGQCGGAMHLTSPPNTLSAEIYLAAAATIQRPLASSANPQSLICCAQYGQNYRNSDPHIGFSANTAAANARISLTNPVGLYLQQPQNFQHWQAPNGEDVSQFWTVTRGTAGTGPKGSDQILHAVFEVPESAGFTIEDITINGQPIRFAGEIANQMHVALSVNTKTPQGAQPVLPCVSSRTTGLQPWPVQFLPESLFYGQSVSDLPGLLNSKCDNRFVLIVQGADKTTTKDNARVQFNNPNVSAKVVDFLPHASAVPGQTNGGGTQAYILDVNVSAAATASTVGVRALNPGEDDNPSDSDHPWEYGLAIIEQ
ncbi:hypothetical protein SIN8267_01125 [Sinobacterium norvegicum]|uniref:Uncharacterized protein n=1 Tax=Sinobacterium norvegicum TaxID=1641715 RepID=A0ABM9ACV7_9GAMM|nr:hypothetical protein [Sinobacterium norvegicum]CAH0991024.1 hypothetical protein SIN8267_01125 [Sinobacterium norvegicum]